MQAFDFLTQNKNHEMAPEGKTMMLDKGLGLNAVDDLLETAGDYISFAKLGWGTSATMDTELITLKNEKYQNHDIITYPGGTLLEVAVMKNMYKQYLQEAKQLGFNGIEVSDGSTTIGVAVREQLIVQAREAGFFVISEVGKKNLNLDHEMTIDERLSLISRDLDSGAQFIIIEAREAGKDIGIYNQAGGIMNDELDALAANGIGHLIFEAPLKNQQVSLILKYGSQVNLGNIATDEVTSLETLRVGLRGDTVGQV
ncbi:phosphosulfolactate synthase [Paucilactobacillus oligofermentans DSM 15707 = LMG 22743]|uniref:Phosphosulfolactate synthase n=1 Tax=Paucilactobacillus oligofermentans DSM 15707 = LMG 22743 TaxID=1423778 RepID=A0A0R1RLH8_9LACO|nr:phosphosulfolactate synthase [Paucilactobacillus oligofermentans]KRL57735.1 phosphosulfolactate synthase [Paucilactobacillus oligofermentans DSM 15707 = LMG 22743]CUS26817.1 Phosphosulfolactate synthase [Paucilactobacillus oligofermentans DSM 15707 = LMG 22743]